MLLHIKHITKYAYDQPVDYALQKVKLRPLGSPMQDIEDWVLTIDGGQVEVGYVDHYGNHVDLVSAAPGTRQITVTAEGHVTTHDRAGVLGRFYGRAPLWHWEQTTALTTAGPAIEALAKTVVNYGSPLAGLHALSAEILDKVGYELGHTSTTTTAEDAAQIGNGVCQDHANIFVAAARHAGFPARYVSGYLLMNDRIDQDASHAWAEAHIPDLGWVGFDVSNGICPDEHYVRIAIGRDAQDATPLAGMRTGHSVESMIVNLQVQQ